MKRKSWNAKKTHPNLPELEALQRNSPKRVQSHPREITPERLGFFSSNSPKQVGARLGVKSHSLRPIRLNIRREA